jgi:hypothetical protein
MDFEKFHSLVVQHTELMLYEAKELNGILFAYTKNNILFACDKAFYSEQEKLDTFRMYSLILFSTQAVMYSFTSEAYFYKKEATDLSPFINPSKHKDKQECVCVISVNKQNKILNYMGKIIRENETIKLIDFDSLFDNQSGLITNFFNDIKDNISETEKTLIFTEFNRLPKPQWFNYLDLDKFCNITKQ